MIEIYLAFTCKFENLSFLYSHVLLILTKSKNQVVREQNRYLKIHQLAYARLT